VGMQNNNVTSRVLNNTLIKTLSLVFVLTLLLKFALAQLNPIVYNLSNSIIAMIILHIGFLYLHKQLKVEGIVPNQSSFFKFFCSINFDYIKAFLLAVLFLLLVMLLLTAVFEDELALLGGLLRVNEQSLESIYGNNGILLMMFSFTIAVYLLFALMLYLFVRFATNRITKNTTRKKTSKPVVYWVLLSALLWLLDSFLPILLHNANYLIALSLENLSNVLVFFLPVILLHFSLSERLESSQ
jgi:hypothetical protein